MQKYLHNCNKSCIIAICLIKLFVMNLYIRNVPTDWINRMKVLASKRGMKNNALYLRIVAAGLIWEEKEQNFFDDKSEKK